MLCFGNHQTCIDRSRRDCAEPVGWTPDSRPLSVSVPLVQDVYPWRGTLQLGKDAKYDEGCGMRRVVGLSRQHGQGKAPSRMIPGLPESRRTFSHPVWEFEIGQAVARKLIKAPPDSPTRLAAWRDLKAWAQSVPSCSRNVRRSPRFGSL